MTRALATALAFALAIAPARAENISVTPSGGGTAAGITINTTTITGGTTNQLLFDNAGTIGEITKGNSCVYLTNGSGVPSCSTTLPTGVVISSASISSGLGYTPCDPANNSCFNSASTFRANLGVLSMGIQAASAVAITGGTVAGLTGFGIRDTSAAFDVTIAAVSSTALTAGRTLTLDMGNVAHIFTLGTTASTGSGIIFPNRATDTVAMLGVANAFTAAQTVSVNGAVSAPAVSITGTIVSGGSATTNKPLFLIEPSGTTSTAWNTSGTGLGVNASLNVGLIADLQIGGTSIVRFTSTASGTADSDAKISFHAKAQTTTNDPFIRAIATSEASDSKNGIILGVDNTSVIGVTTNGLNLGAKTLQAGSATAFSVSPDTGLSRISAALWGMGNGTAADVSGSLNLTNLTGTGTIIIGTGDAASSTGGALQVTGGGSVAKRFWLPAITTSSGLQTAVLCQSSGGEVIADSVACLASSEDLKEIVGDSMVGLKAILAMRPIDYRYALTGNSRFDNAPNQRAIHPGLGAKAIAEIDPHLVAYDPDGKVRTIRQDSLSAVIVKAIQEQQAQIDQLRVAK